MTGTSLIDTMADRYLMDAQLFQKTIRATVMPTDHTDEQFRAFMMVAFQYGLNPITREIYAYPARKGGGIIPVVSIDGWLHLVNSHPQCDGFEFHAVRDDAGKLTGMTCVMHRKDRSYPIVITEILSEVYRNTDPWNQMPARMLRHKALKEAARYAFGFAGITDEDEARDQMRDVTGTVKTIEQPIITGGVVEQLDQFISASVPQTADVDAGAADAETQSRQSDLAEVKREAIDKLLREATDKQFDVDVRLDNLDAQIPVWEDRLGEEGGDFLKNAVTYAAKVAKGDVKEATARKYLEGL